MTIPAYLPYFVLAGTAAAIIAILYGLQSRAWPTRRGRRRIATRTFRTSAVILIGWLAVSHRARRTRASTTPRLTEIPTIQYGIVLPILIGACCFGARTRRQRIIDAVPQPWLVGVQLYRALGVIFLILYATRQAAWPVRLACRYRRHRHRSARARSWGSPMRGRRAIPPGSSRPGTCSAFSISSSRSTTGFHDRAIAVPTRRGLSRTSELMTVLPMVLIPVYLVPLSIVLHFASLAKLHRASGAERQRRREQLQPSTRSSIYKAASRLSRTRGRCLIAARTPFPASPAGCGLEIM